MMPIKRVVIAIGYSAGGQEPLQDFFDATPTDDVTYVVLRHLPPFHLDALKFILSRHCALEIIEAADQMDVEKNKVYLMPPDHNLEIDKNRFHLVPRVKGSANEAVDIFLYSIANDIETGAITVILSGSGSDGAKGAARIKDTGDLVIVQDPSTCEHPEMPEATIAATSVDYTLEPGEMPVIISQYVKERYPEILAVSQ
jgi:two-component system CheB/CheR fusion protein